MKSKLESLILKKAIQEYGAFAQLDMIIEEMSELTKEICKNKRGKDNRSAIVEEMADVYIMLKQLEIIFSIDEDEINEAIDFKVDRLKERLEHGQ